jgi:DNA-binding IclR family transcriptional regulator
MSSLQLDDGVQTLLVTKLDSYERLEIMRVLHGAGRTMSQSELVDACGLSSDDVDDALASLGRSKLVEHDPANHGIRVGPASADPCFATLMQAYNEDRAAVLAVLSSALMQRLRSMAARAFADAFVIRKKRGDDG